MSTSREYQLTMEAILCCVNSLPEALSTKAHLLWQRGGGAGLGAWADSCAIVEPGLEPYTLDTLETLRDLCICFNDMITEDLK